MQCIKENKGKKIDLLEKGIKISINNAERIEINPDFIDKYHKHANKKEYYTCRNWQFAHMINEKFGKGKKN